MIYWDWGEIMQVECEHIWCRYNNGEGCELDCITIDCNGQCRNCFREKGARHRQKVEKMMKEAGIVIAEYDKFGNRIYKENE